MNTPGPLSRHDPDRNEVLRSTAYTILILPG